MIFFYGSVVGAAFGQSCTSNPTTISSNTNFASISWTGAGGVSAATCAAIASGLNTSTTANFFVDLANNTVLTINNNVTINGTFDITGGPGSNLTVNGGGPSTTLHVTGNLGDATNNGVDYVVTGVNDKIKVDGTLYGKNNNALSGNGSISGGSINVKNGTTCSSPCPASGGFTTCTAGDSFCTTYSLPVTLLFFSGALNSDYIKLSWATASELNFDYFDLEKSSNGKDFFSLANVNGHGTTNERHDYSFEDNFPLVGKNYYRLTSVDFDSYRETFKVIVQNYSGEKTFQASPNPSDGLSLTLTFNFDQSDGQVTIYDNMGIFIASFQVQESSRLLFSNPLRSGIYFAKFSSPALTKTIRFLVN